MEHGIGEYFQPELDDTDWGERSVYWAEVEPLTLKTEIRKSKKKGREPGPLILTGHGVKLSLDRGTLLVQNGFSHYPQERKQWHFFPGDRNLPSRIVVLDGAGGLSFQVLSWLSAQSVPLIQVDWQGNILNVAGDQGRAVDLKLATSQRAAHENGHAGRIAVQLVRSKIANAIETLRTSFPKGPASELAITAIEKVQTSLQTASGLSGDRLRGIEGGVGYAYFRAWNSVPIRWKGTSRRPIPDDWRRIGWRRSHISNRNRNAHHPVNAMLNYAYGILENEVRMHLVGAGFDLSIGVLHTSYERQQPLVYDLMEPLRPIVDRAILSIVQVHTFTPGDFTLLDSGVCRVNPRLATSVVGQVDCSAEAEKLATQTAKLFAG